MKLFVSLISLSLIVSAAVASAEAQKASLSISDGSVTVAADQLSKSAGVSIVVDPAIDAKVTLTLNNVELPTALDMLAKMSKSTWKKVQYAKPEDEKVAFGQIKSTVLTLASMPLVAVSVADGSGKASTFTTGASDSPGIANVKLPDGYSWTTVYAIYSEEKPAMKPDQSARKTSDPVNGNSVDESKLADMGKEAFDKPIDMANMSQQERQQLLKNEMMGLMTLVPEARKQLLRDQMSAAASMDPQQREQYRRELRDAMRLLNPPRQRTTQPRTNQPRTNPGANQPRTPGQNQPPVRNR